MFVFLILLNALLCNLFVHKYKYFLFILDMVIIAVYLLGITAFGIWIGYRKTASSQLVELNLPDNSVDQGREQTAEDDSQQVADCDGVSGHLPRKPPRCGRWADECFYR